MKAKTHDPVATLVRVSGAALVGGGALAALLNLILSPMLPVGEGTAVVAASTAFGIRMPVAAASVALVTFGLPGLYLAQAERLRFGGIAFLIAGLGGLTAFFDEAVQATLVRDMAINAPETLTRLEEAGHLGRYDLFFAIGAGIFLLGWLGVVVLTWRTKVLPSRGPKLFLAGVILIPLLGILLSGVWGMALGNVVLGSGWVLLGLDLGRLATPQDGTRASADEPA